MKIAIYGRSLSKEHYAFMELLFEELKKVDAQLFIHENFISELKKALEKMPDFSIFSSHKQLVKNKIDFLFSIGGDGAILDTVTLVRNSEIPVLGINIGRLGFLSSITPNELKKTLVALTKKNYKLDKRTVLKLETPIDLYGKDNFALNEFTVMKKDTSSMIKIHAYVDDEFLNTYWADGLIVATATGSTAYSLSCGGPIVLPGSGNLILTPIAPHNLNVRPIVVPDTKTITLKLEGRSEDFLIALDSRAKTVNDSVELKLKKEKFSLNLVRTRDYSFSATLRNKLNWGLDSRN